MYIFGILISGFRTTFNQASRASLEKTLQHAAIILISVKPCENSCQLCKI